MAVSRVTVRDTRLQSLQEEYTPRIITRGGQGVYYSYNVGPPITETNNAAGFIQTGTRFVIGGVLYEVTSPESVTNTGTITTQNGQTVVGQFKLQFNTSTLKFRFTPTTTADGSGWTTLVYGLQEATLTSGAFTTSTKVLVGGEGTTDTTADQTIPAGAATGRYPQDIIYSGRKGGYIFAWILQPTSAPESLFIELETTIYTRDEAGSSLLSDVLPLPRSNRPRPYKLYIPPYSYVYPQFVLSTSSASQVNISFAFFRL